MSDLHTVRSAADRLGVAYSTLKQWIYDGSIRTTKTRGGHHRIAESEIQRALMTQEKPGVTKAASAPGGILVALSGRNQLRGIVDEVRSDGLLSQVRLRIGDQFLTRRGQRTQAQARRRSGRHHQVHRGNDRTNLERSSSFAPKVSAWPIRVVGSFDVSTECRFDRAVVFGAFCGPGSSGITDHHHQPICGADREHRRRRRRQVFRVRRHP
jgi:excisionase family DNA binding protein